MNSKKELLIYKAKFFEKCEELSTLRNQIAETERYYNDKIMEIKEKNQKEHKPKRPIGLVSPLNHEERKAKFGEQKTRKGKLLDSMTRNKINENYWENIIMKTNERCTMLEKKLFQLINEKNEINLELKHTKRKGKKDLLNQKNEAQELKRINKSLEKELETLRRKNKELQEKNKTAKGTEFSLRSNLKSTKDKLKKIEYKYNSILNKPRNTKQS